MKFKRRKRSYKKRQRTPRQRQNRLRKYMKLGMAVLGKSLRGIGCTAGYRRKSIQKSL